MKPPTTENLGKLMIRFVLLLCQDVVGGFFSFSNPSPATDDVAFFFFFARKSSEELQLLRGTANNENASTALLDDCNNDITTPLSKYFCISNSRCG